MLNEVTYMGPLIIEKKGKFDVYLSSLPHLTCKHSDSKGSDNTNFGLYNLQSVLEFINFFFLNSEGFYLFFFFVFLLIPVS